MLALPTDTMSIDEQFGVVIYTDGGARPNPGMIGSGAHGYVYTTKLGKQGTGLSTHHVTKDGYISKKINDKPFIQVEPLFYIDYFGPSEGTGSNNIAELSAFNTAVKYTLEFADTHKVRALTVVADSDYVKRGALEYIDGWRSRGWRKSNGEFINNKELWIETDSLLQQLKSKQVLLTINWVKGHSEDLGNKLADELATIGVYSSGKQKFEPKFKITPAKGYWTSEVDKHPFFNHAFLYFNSIQEANESGVYYLGDPGKDNPHHGKKTPDASYAVIKLKTPDPVIEFIRNYQCSLLDGINKVFTMDLLAIHNRSINSRLTDFKDLPLVRKRIKPYDLMYLDKQELTTEQNPTGLTLRAVENLNLLEASLNSIFSTNVRIKEHASQLGYETLVDITEVFYTLEAKGNGKMVSVLKPEFKVGHAGVDIRLYNNEKPFEVPVRFGYDILDRNNMKRLEDENPHVFLVVWRMSEVSFKYATAITCDNASGIWCNYFANNIIVKDGE